MEGEVIDILSIFNGKLLIGHKRFAQIFVFSEAGNHLETFTVNNDAYIDAVWTPRGNILYSTSTSKRVVVMSISGEFIKHTLMIDPQEFSIFKDGVIYLADWTAGIFQSTDDGQTWNFIFKNSDGWLCRQVIKVTTDDDNEFWTQDRGYNLLITRNAQVHVFREQTLGASIVPLKEINVNAPDGRIIIFLSSRLLYDGNINVFLNECDNKAVHMLSVNGQYRCQLLSSCHIKNEPYKLAIDKDCRQLYVGERGSVVEVFKLKYEESE